MNDARSCPRCGGPVHADAPEGDCPACLLRAGLSHPHDAPDLLDLETVRSLFPRLAIEARIGRGGMGVVFRARQRSLDRPVALKVLPPELLDRPGFAARFAREAQSLARLDHPNIVRVFEADRDGDVAWLLMEFVDGTDLRAAMAAGVTPAQALRIVSEICEALQYAHDRGVVHRDIKPENILLDRAGRVKIADFGLAKLADDRGAERALTRSHDVMGTAHYMAPEQMRGGADIDHRADIYSLGVVFYELLTGDLPVGRFAPPSQRVSVDVRLDDVVMRALENERERRFQRVDEVKTDVGVIAASPGRASAGGARSARGAADRGGAPDRGAPAPAATRTSGKALFSALAPAIGLGAGALVFAVGMGLSGGRTSDALQAASVLIALAVVVAGMIVSRVARREIDADPRLTGRRLATAGIVFPILFAVVAIVGMGAVTVYLRRSHVQRVAEAEFNRLRMEQLAAANELIGRLAAIEHGGVAAALECFTPEAREGLAALTPEAWIERGATGDLGLPGMVLSKVLRAGQLTIETSPFETWRGSRCLRLRSPRGVVRAPVAEVGNEVRFLAGRVETEEP